MRTRFFFAAILAISCCLIARHAQAASQLIPTPYPEMLGPNSMEQPVPQPHYHQRLIEDPAPAEKGPNALGNPHIHRHPHFLHDPYPRQWWRRHY